MVWLYLVPCCNYVTGVHFMKCTQSLPHTPLTYFFSICTESLPLRMKREGGSDVSNLIYCIALWKKKIKQEKKCTQDLFEPLLETLLAGAARVLHAQVLASRVLHAHWFSQCCDMREFWNQCWELDLNAMLKIGYSGVSEEGMVVLAHKPRGLREEKFFHKLKQRLKVLTVVGPDDLDASFLKSNVFIHLCRRRKASELWWLGITGAILVGGHQVVIWGHGGHRNCEVEWTVTDESDFKYGTSPQYSESLYLENWKHDRTHELVWPNLRPSSPEDQADVWSRVVGLYL